ncbi:amidase [Pseudoroseicyclus sp. CXY001]|uniref:amidase n=1 Tax=Pseudoroseicyclus sp. CXY001 TaxID=3242492 RepID=UPI00358DD83E
MSDLTQRSASELAVMIGRREVSATEVMAAHLAAIRERNAALNAIVSMAEPEELMAAAQAADAAEPVGPLHGLPLAVKDLSHAAGFPTSMGSPIHAGEVAEVDDLHVARLRRAGAIVVGKTNVPEFGLGSQSYNPVFGRTGLPGDPGLTAGGSSGGAAAALAARLVPLADGSDMMGSLRNPAGWCGIWSLRPTWGLVPGDGEGDLFLHPLSTVGPMGRVPADVELMLSVMAGPDARHPFPAPAYRPLPEDSPLPHRIGWLGDWGGALPMEEGVLRACEYQLARLAEAGAEVAPVAPPLPAEALWEAWTTLRSLAVAGSLGPYLDAPERRDRLKPAAIWEVERGRALGASQILRASALRSDWFRAASALFEQHDMLALPTAQCFPYTIGTDWPGEIAGRAMDSYHRWMEVTVAAALIGLPVLTMPIRGRRMGLQLIGPKGSDARLLAYAKAVEAR